MGPNGSPLTTITSEDDFSRAPSPFLDSNIVDTLTALRTSPDVMSTATVNTNTLDEKQRQLVAQDESVKCRSQT